MGIVCKVVYMGLFALINNNDIATITSIILGGGIYFVVLFFIGALDRDILVRIPIVKKYV